MEAESSSPETAGRDGTRRVAMVVVIAILVGGGLAALVITRSPAPSSTTSSTSITGGPDLIVSSAAATNPSGFVLESTRPSVSVRGAQSGYWAILGQPDGSVANLTALVYTSTNSSEAYFERLVTGARGLAGYTDITSNLAAFQQYGNCYGYGEDVDGIAVANGVCTKGNAVLEVHLVSSIPFSTLAADLTDLMGSLYLNAN